MITFKKNVLSIALMGLSLAAGSAFSGTQVSIVGKDFYINGAITGSSPGQKGMLPNSRMVQATFDDENPATVKNFVYPDTKKWDPDRQTQEFVDALPSYRHAGLLAVTLNFQGGRPKSSFTGSTQPQINTGFNADGSLKPAYLVRMDKAIRALDANGMVAIVGLFYGGQSSLIKGDDAIVAAVKNTVDWILDQKYTNVMIEIVNELGKSHFPTHPILQSSDKVATLVALAHTRSGGKIPVSASLGGGGVPSRALVNASDYVLVHGNGLSPSGIAKRVKDVRALTATKPIVFNEDSTSLSNYKAAVKAGASWGYYDMGKNNYKDGFQSPPTNWDFNSASKKKEFFALISIL